ncbi:hypothetical protein LQ564_18970 [Massilia sp. G4R7]|uniref:Uncharacterized protein n=1 Tax=Massilia phyllostachyos TaxID=2898585 RepID=A0ABS8QBR4_9BURK|nr:hypothetical protein [Massilia phyllostachyos]MCD2518386.1 hypothetical protein [Massilia phyllostachyos]
MKLATPPRATISLARQAPDQVLAADPGRRSASPQLGAVRRRAFEDAGRGIGRPGAGGKVADGGVGGQGGQQDQARAQGAQGHVHEDSL